MYIYVLEYKSTLTDSVLILIHKLPMPHVSIVNQGLKLCHSVGGATSRSLRSSCVLVASAAW